MTQVGTIIDNKFEILTQIGKGGMSTVWLARDKNLNKQWAIKEIRQNAEGKSDELVISSLKREAELMKGFDHPVLPHIIDIIETGTTYYVVMEYIEGRSLDKILKEEGIQSEEDVVKWAMQLADGLSYLHKQKPPVVYRDMKPANVMLKPNGDVKLIDFGIAREYKEEHTHDTTVLGTKGYAPPEQYCGQTDARSDIFALGMTMHHLLTGVDPDGDTTYAPARQWNPDISEGVELIIDHCVEPAAENRYQTCADLIYDLQHPELITSGYKRQQRLKLAAFGLTLGLSIAAAGAGFSLRAAATSLNTQDYEANIAITDPDNYYTAIGIYPERTDAYELLIDYYKNHDCENSDIERLGNIIETNADSLDADDADVAELYYDMGKLFFAEYDGSLKARAVNAKSFFATAVESEAEYDKKDIASCYYSVCKFMTEQSTTAEHTAQDYEELFAEIDEAISIVSAASDSEANYDKISLYYVTMLLINDQVEYLAGLDYDEDAVLERMEELYNSTNGITSTLSYVNELQDEIMEDYSTYVANIEAKYNEVAKRRGGE